MMAPKKIIVDCDPGPDDAQALMMLLAAKEDVEVVAVTTVFGNTEVDHTKINALRTLQICGRLDVSNLRHFTWIPLHKGLYF